MKVVILYRPNSEQGRKVEDFARDFSRVNLNRKLELVNIDTRDGMATATLYDVMRNPAVLALTDDGQLLKDWQGESLPLMNEISYYTTA